MGHDVKSESRRERFQHCFNGDGVITFDEYMANYRRHQLSEDVMPFYFCAD